MICCDGLVKIYMTDNRKVMALEGLDLTIKTGEMMAIIGKSGSGKSTLLHMIGGLETPTAGSILIDGKDISTLKEKEIVAYRRNTIGFLWQKSARNLFPYLTALQNIETMMRLGKKYSKERALKLLQAVGMEQHANKFPNQLSGGEQQRVSIAVALANQPSILLADEPTGAVDSQTAQQIFQLFHELNGKLGITIIIVTHDLALADKVDRTVLISDGKISTEKIRQVQKAADFQSHEEYSVMDKAHRIQLSEDVLEEAGITSDKVKVEVVEGKVVISRPE